VILKRTATKDAFVRTTAGIEKFEKRAGLDANKRKSDV
jgi:hypothetical protein